MILPLSNPIVIEMEINDSVPSLIDMSHFRRLLQSYAFPLSAPLRRNQSTCLLARARVYMCIYINIHVKMEQSKAQGIKSERLYHFITIKLKIS